jgi:chaperonin cofactor prefoldin
MPNNTNELFTLWQKQFQAFMADPAVINAMLNNHKAFQDYLHEFYQQSTAPQDGKNNTTSTSGDVFNPGSTIFIELANRLEQLEKRVAALEEENRSLKKKAAK